VGSVPLQNSEQVFRTAAAVLGGRLRRIPDGETGERRSWIGWQVGVLDRVPELEFLPPAKSGYSPSPRFQLRSSTGDITQGGLGYANAAIASYAVFTRLREEGTVPATYRFQVSLPTPLAVVGLFVVPQDQPSVEPAYEGRLLAELDEIRAAIPHDDLAIQWDVAVEVAMLEGILPAPFHDVRDGIQQRLIHLGRLLPEDVELGYHLCYGDSGHRHFKEPDDLSELVDLANVLTEGIQRTVNWIHLPVPRTRIDDAYFLSLRRLRLQPETELYLGLVHYTDGVPGTRRRIQAAQRSVADFGIATECGMGRRPPETVPDLLRIHAKVAASVA
jgi:hypothetical protein